MSEHFLRTEMLLGAEAMSMLAASHVAVFGLGGVGSWCAEALARAGIGELTLVDQDTVSESNINRQLLATEDTIGLSKAQAMANRIQSINRAACLHPRQNRYEAATRDSFFETTYDFIVDAIDLVACKLDLIETAHHLEIPIISALGTGNKTDASLLRICDISKTMGCPLARVVRKELRKRGTVHHMVVFSPEEGLDPEQREAPPPGRRSVPGSLVWVPATAGMLLAQYVVLQLTAPYQIQAM
jgi:tRNA A37 threonylcarbamoyladenosine dehydratase